MKNTKHLGTEPIGKLLIEFSIPAIIAMVVNAIYNIVDRIFIGKYVGEQALAGLTIAFPIMIIIFAVAALIGQGGANLISIKLGEKDNKGADRVFTNTIVMAVVLGMFMIILGVLNLNILLRVLGADQEVFTNAKDYMNIIFMGVIFQLIAFNLNNMARAEGFPVIAMQSMVISGVTNIILDYVFIGLMGIGVKGAALATIIGQFIGLLILFKHFIKGESSLKIDVKHIIPDKKVVGKILSVGSPTFITTIGTSASMMVLNIYLGKYGGTPAITSMGAINSLYTLVIMPILGIQGGMKPIVGYNYGARKFTRVNETLLKAVGIGIVFSTIVFTILQLFPETFISLFLDKSSDTMHIAVNGLKVYIATLPIVCINIFGVGYFQAIANSKKAIMLGSLRQFVYLLPLLLTLPHFFNLKGVWISVPIADFMAVVTTLALLIHDIRLRKNIKVLDLNYNEWMRK